ncbi:MAG: winged helix-turn-helix domain-containing protein, partial [Longimicrobiales bacterium]
MRYTFGEYTLDTELYTLLHSDQQISVEPRVFDVLVYLIEHRDRVVPKEALVENVWSGAFITDGALKRAIVEARRAIGDDGQQQEAIQTLYGRGYRFVRAVEEEPAAPPTPPPLARRRWAIALASMVVVVLALAGGWAVLQRRTPPGVPPSIDRLAVFPFSVRGGEEFAYLGEGMVDLLSSNLDGAAELRSIDPRAVVSAAAHAGEGLSDPEEAGRVAERLGAGLYVLGDIVEAGGRLRISGRLYGASEQGGGPVLASVEGTAAQLFELVDALTAQLLAGWPEGPGGRVARLAATTTESVAALKAYLEGERLFRGGRLHEAIEPLQRATQIDNTFALAYYRLATAYWGPERQELAMEAIERAVRHSSRVGDRTRQLIQAFDAILRERYAEAERSYRQIVTDYPDDVEAWVKLGFLILRRGMFLGRSWSEAREALERVLSL